MRKVHYNVAVTCKNSLQNGDAEAILFYCWWYQNHSKCITAFLRKPSMKFYFSGGKLYNALVNGTFMLFSPRKILSYKDHWNWVEMSSSWLNLTISFSISESFSRRSGSMGWFKDVKWCRVCSRINLSWAAWRFPSSVAQISIFKWIDYITHYRL